MGTLFCVQSKWFKVKRTKPCFILWSNLSLASYLSNLNLASGIILPLWASHWLLLHVLPLLLLLVNLHRVLEIHESTSTSNILSCCCGKCAPKKPDDEDEDCPDLGDLGGEEETEVSALF